MVVPAEKGAETLLKSALKAGSRLSSVVITSSVVAVVNPQDDPTYVFTEADWASAALETAIKNRDNGSQTPANVLYAASKTASDRVVWKFRDEHNVCFPYRTLKYCLMKRIADICDHNDQPLSGDRSTRNSPFH